MKTAGKKAISLTIATDRRRRKRTPETHVKMLILSSKNMGVCYILCTLL